MELAWSSQSFQLFNALESSWKMAGSTIYIRAGNGEKGLQLKIHHKNRDEKTCSPARSFEKCGEHGGVERVHPKVWRLWWSLDAMEGNFAVVHFEVMWPYTQVFNYFNWIVPFNHFLMIFPELSRLSWSLALWRQQISDRLALWLSKIRQQHSTLLTGLRTKFQMRP